MAIRAEMGKGRIDWVFIAAAGGLVAMGTIMMLSAASPLPYYTQILQRHFIALALGSLLFFLGLGFNYQIFQDQAKVLYGVALAMLTAVLLIGATQRGHRAWFHFSFLTFQPAELARIITILVMAALLDWRSRKMDQISSVLMALGVAGPVMFLIVKQPDFSTTLTFCPILLGMLFCSGAKSSHLFTVIGFGATAACMPLIYTYCQVRYPQAAAGSWPYFILQTSRLGMTTVLILMALAAASALAWRLSVMLRLQAKIIYFVAVPIILAAGMFSGAVVTRGMKSYQRNRFVAYVAPHADIQGAAYNVHQSQIAIGSGGLLGKGLFSGTQSQLGFLPERHTDFIYAVVGEEMGFVGAMAILFLYMMLIWRIVSAGRLARDRYGYLISCGFATMFAFQMVLNVGMCVGLMPVAGIPLPLVSYGGSSLVITLWALGVIANIYSRRYSLL